MIMQERWAESYYRVRLVFLICFFLLDSKFISNQLSSIKQGSENL